VKEDGSLGLSSSIDEPMSILKMNYLVYGEVVEDHGTLLRDALVDGRSRIVGGDESIGNTACL